MKILLTVLNMLCVLFQFMQEFYNRTYLDRNGVPMDSSFQTLLWSLTVSMFPLGGFFGSLMVWPMVNNCGRYVTELFDIPHLPHRSLQLAQPMGTMAVSHTVIAMQRG